MKITRTLPDLRAACADLARTRPLALVPTMGALHEGHCTLLSAAFQTGAAVVASIFVNPLQFAPNEDFTRYPRDEEGDLQRLRESGCDLAWLPDVETMYPPGEATQIEVAGPALRWEGSLRPGHFRGVATVVAKLFGQVRPQAAYFGEKDWQQLQVITRMVTDLLLPVTVVPVPTVRETEGLALSSRNRYLSAEQRRIAPFLHQIMVDAARRLATGAPSEAILAEAGGRLTEAGFVLDYLALVDGPTLEPLEAAVPGSRIIAAARLGSVRLIDNIAAA
jgi:pantoate--beta-alanine ligase